LAIQTYTASKTAATRPARMLRASNGPGPLAPACSAGKTLLASLDPTFLSALSRLMPPRCADVPSGRGKSKVLAEAFTASRWAGDVCISAVEVYCKIGGIGKSTLCLWSAASGAFRVVL